MSPHKPIASVPHKTKAWSIVVVGALLVLLFVMLFLNSMDKPVTRDEQMYCTAGVLLLDGLHIYQDFAYVSQLPYHPLLLAGLYKLCNTTHYLLVARMVTVLSELGAMICIFGIIKVVFTDQSRLSLLLGSAGCVLYAMNPLVYMANGYAWNHGVVVFLVLASLWLYLTIVRSSLGTYIKLTTIGVLLTIASGMRITTVLVYVVFLIGVWWKCRETGLKLRYALACYLSGTLLAAIWPVFILSQSFDAFCHNLITIPRLYGQWLIDQGIALDKLEIVLICLLQPGYLVLVILTIVIWVAYKRTPPGPQKTSIPSANLWLTTALPLVFLIIAFIPPTMWRQYSAVPVPFLILSIAYPYHHLSLNLRREHKTCLAWFAGVCMTVILVFQIVTLYLNPLKTNLKDWIPIQLHDQACIVAEHIEEDAPVLTLGPLWALEGGCTIYPELACGSIVFRIADQLTSEQLRLTRTVGPNSLTDLLVQTSPAAILTGTETGPFVRFEDDLIRQRPDWSRIPDGGELMLYREE